MRGRLKGALPQELIYKTTDEPVKRLKSLSISEFKKKGCKIRFETSNNVMEKIDETINAIERVNVGKCQKKLQKDNKFLLKQKKLIRLAEREN